MPRLLTPSCANSAAIYAHFSAVLPMAPDGPDRTIDARQMAWRRNPMDSPLRAATEYMGPSLSLQDYPAGRGECSRSPAPIVSRHVTIPDVAPPSKAGSPITG